MAQDVAEHHPDAVIEHPSGYLMVDYDKALGDSGWEAFG
jgi:hypothetical protein